MQLKDARSREEAQKLELEEIKQERTELQSQLQASQMQHTEVNSQIWSLRIEKQTMTNKVRFCFCDYDCRSGMPDFELDIGPHGETRTG